MSTFTLAISCLTASNLPWFTDLTFQVPMQYCSLQHQTFLLSPVTSKAGYCLCFGSIPSFFLELFLHGSPVAYWAPTDLGSFSFSILSFCLFILLMGFSRQEYWSGLPFPSPVDHIPFYYRGLECKSRKSRNTWSNRKIWPWNTDEAGQRLVEFCQEKALLITNTLFQQHKRRFCTNMDITR